MFRLLDSYPFGSPIPNRAYTSAGGAYRYGFNGQEKDDEIAGAGNSNTAEFWQYDARLGRRWNIDPKPNSSISNYACFANNPILFRDPYGDTLRLSFESNDARKKYVKLVNSFLGGQFAIKLIKVKDVEGFTEQVVLTAVKGGEYGKMNAKQKRFFEVFCKVLADKAIAKQEIVESDPKVYGGRYEDNKLDLSDVDSFDKVKKGVTGSELFIHETVEQLSKSKMGYKAGDRTKDIFGDPTGFTVAHIRAKRAEGYVGNYERTENTDGTHTTKDKDGSEFHHNLKIRSDGSINVIKTKIK